MDPQGDRLGSRRGCPLSTPEKIIYLRREVNSVDKSPVSEAIWCDEVLARGMFVGENRLSVVLQRGQGAVHIVVEEGKVKLMCTSCYMKAVQLPFS